MWLPIKWSPALPWGGGQENTSASLGTPRRWKALSAVPRVSWYITHQGEKEFASLARADLHNRLHNANAGEQLGASQASLGGQTLAHKENGVLLFLPGGEAGLGTGLSTTSVLISLPASPLPQ